MAGYIEIISKEKLQRIKEKGELARQRRAQEKRARLEKKKRYSADDLSSSTSTSSQSYNSQSSDSSYSGSGDIFSSISQASSQSSTSSDYNSPALDFLGSLASAGLQEQEPRQIHREPLGGEIEKAKSEMNTAYLEETFLEMAGKFQEFEERLKKIEKRLGFGRGEKDFAY